MFGIVPFMFVIGDIPKSVELVNSSYLVAENNIRPLEALKEHIKQRTRGEMRFLIADLRSIAFTSELILLDAVK